MCLCTLTQLSVSFFFCLCICGCSCVRVFPFLCVRTIWQIWCQFSALQDKGVLLQWPHSADTKSADGGCGWVWSWERTFDEYFCMHHPKLENRNSLRVKYFCGNNFLTACGQVYTHFHKLMCHFYKENIIKKGLQHYSRCHHHNFMFLVPLCIYFLNWYDLLPACLYCPSVWKRVLHCGYGLFLTDKWRLVSICLDSTCVVCGT